MRAFINLISLVVLLLFGYQTGARANLVLNGNFATGDLTDWSLAAENMSLGTGGQVTQSIAPDVLFLPLVVSTSLGFAWSTIGDMWFASITQDIATIPGHTYEVQYVLTVPGGFFGPPCTVSGNNCIPNGLPGYSPGTFLGFFGSDAFLANDTWINCFPAGCTTAAPPLQDLTAIGADVGLFYDVGTFAESFEDVATNSITSLEFAGVTRGPWFLTTDIVVTDITASVPEPASIALFAPALFGFVLFRRKRRAQRLG